MWENSVLLYPQQESESVRASSHAFLQAFTPSVSAGLTVATGGARHSEGSPAHSQQLNIHNKTNRHRLSDCEASGLSEASERTPWKALEGRARSSLCWTSHRAEHPDGSAFSSRSDTGCRRGAGGCPRQSPTSLSGQWGRLGLAQEKPHLVKQQKCGLWSQVTLGLKARSVTSWLSLSLLICERG